MKNIFYISRYRPVPLHKTKWIVIRSARLKDKWQKNFPEYRIVAVGESIVGAGFYQCYLTTKPENAKEKEWFTQLNTRKLNKDSKIF